MSARVTAQPTMASGAVKIGKSFTGSRQAVGVSGFAGKPLKARAVSMGRRVAAHQPLRVVAEKVVGIDLGTTNSAVRTPSRRPPRPRFRRSSDRHQDARVVWSLLFFQGWRVSVRGREEARTRDVSGVRRPADAHIILGRDHGARPAGGAPTRAPNHRTRVPTCSELIGCPLCGRRHLLDSSNKL